MFYKHLVNSNDFNKTTTYAHYKNHIIYVFFQIIK